MMHCNLVPSAAPPNGARGDRAEPSSHLICMERRSTARGCCIGVSVTHQENTMERAQPSVQIDNDHLRVTEWRFAPGAATGHHVHEYTYVVVPMTTGKLLLDEPEGKRYAQLTA